MRESVYTIERISSFARKFIESRDRKTQRRIAEAFDHICNISPFYHPNPRIIKRLKGKHKGRYRYRIGDIRIIYRVNQKSKSIDILEVDSRGDIYK